RFWILEFGGARKTIEPRNEQAFDHAGRGIETAVQVNCAEHGFEGVRENRLTSKSAGLELARAQSEMIAEVDFGRDDGERFPADETRAKARQIALIGRPELSEHEHRNDAIEDRIA